MSRGSKLPIYPSVPGEVIIVTHKANSGMNDMPTTLTTYIRRDNINSGRRCDSIIKSCTPVLDKTKCQLIKNVRIVVIQHECDVMS